MKTLRGLWMPVLLGTLLICTVVGVASARPNARPLQQGWRVLTVPPAACVSRDDGHAWWHEVTYLECQESGVTCAFLCPVNFPAAGEQAVGAVDVKRLTMFAYDNNGSGDINAHLYKVYPPTGGGLIMASAGTTGASTTDPQGDVMDTSIVNNPVYRTQAPYIWVDVPQMSIKLYGFFVHYTWWGGQPPPPPGDTQGPTISQITWATSPMSWPDAECTSGTPNEVHISATIVDPSEVSGAKVVYRVLRGGLEGEWRNVPMSELRGRYQVTITGEHLQASSSAGGFDPAGAEQNGTLRYYIQAFDGVGNSSQSPWGSATIQYCYFLR